MHYSLIKTLGLLFFLTILPSRGIASGNIFISLDNDVFAQSDDDYTNGFQVGWVSDYLNSYKETSLPSSLASWFDEFDTLNRYDRQRFLSYSISHRIFTPSDITESQLIENDIPYSAMLFSTLTVGAQDETTMDAYSFHFGIVGPSARGKEVQSGFHEIIGSDEVLGWDNQIRDELIFNINYEKRRRLSAFDFGANYKGDVISQLGITGGNLISMGTAGIAMRFGVNLPNDFAIPPQFFGEETIGSRSYSRHQNGPSHWFFLLLNTSYIANAIFWDGNTFKDSPSIKYDEDIQRLYFGGVWRTSDISVSFSIAKTTVPWDNPTDKSIQTYGRLGLVFNF